jgi:ribosomal protein S18
MYQPSGSATNQRTAGYLSRNNRNRLYVDYKKVDELRRLMTPNGKIHSRKRSGASSWEQRAVAQAIKRARYMALLPYTSATL